MTRHEIRRKVRSVADCFATQRVELFGSAERDLDILVRLDPDHYNRDKPRGDAEARFVEHLALIVPLPVDVIFERPSGKHARWIAWPYRGPLHTADWIAFLAVRGFHVRVRNLGETVCALIEQPNADWQPRDGSTVVYTGRGGE